MNVGIIGSGIVAQTLGAGFLKHNHAVRLGSRDPRKLAEWQGKHPGATVGSFAEAAAGSHAPIKNRRGGGWRGNDWRSC